jgi:hypothetical protein
MGIAVHHAAMGGRTMLAARLSCFATIAALALAIPAQAGSLNQLGGKIEKSEKFDKSDISRASADGDRAGTSVQVPKLDGASKDSAKMGIKLNSQVQHQTGGSHEQISVSQTFQNITRTKGGCKLCGADSWQSR